MNNIQEVTPGLHHFPMPAEMEDVDIIELAEAARARLAGEFAETSLLPSEKLSYGDRAVYVKRADELPGRCFKPLSAMNTVAAYAEEGETDFVFATAGSFGIGVGYAIQRYGGHAIAYVPEGTSRDKQELMRELGVKVHEQGKVFEDSWRLAERVAAQNGLKLLHPFATKEAIGGVAIMGLELAEQRPDMTHLVLQYGGGSLSSAVAWVLKQTNPGLHVTIAQAEGSTSFVDAVHTGKVKVSTKVDNQFGGLAVSEVHPFTLGLASRLVDATTVVDSLSAHATMYDYQQESGTLPEMAAAVGLEGLRRVARWPKLSEEAVIVGVLSGANPDPILPLYLAARSRRRAEAEQHPSWNSRQTYQVTVA